MKQAMNRFCALIYGSDDGLGGGGGLEELALLQLERLLALGRKNGDTVEKPGS